DAVHTLRVDALDLGMLAEPRARTLQALVNGVLALKQSKRDLPGAETAECLQREDELRFGRDRGIGANEEQPEHVVVDLLLRVVDVDFGVVPLVSFLAPKLVEHVVVRDTVEPRAWIIGQLGRPRLRRLEECGLRGVFAELHAMKAESPRENGDQAPELVSEPMLGKIGRGHVRTM